MQADWPHPSHHLDGDSFLRIKPSLEVTDLSGSTPALPNTVKGEYDYEAMFTTVSDLDIASGYEVRTPPSISDLTITPSVLAKYKMSNEPSFSTYLTPPPSTMKATPLSSSQLFLQPLTPPTSQTPQFSSPTSTTHANLDSYPRYNLQLNAVSQSPYPSGVSRYDESESDYLSDQAYSPTLDDFSSPQFVPTAQFTSPPASTPHNHLAQQQVSRLPYAPPQTLQDISAHQELSAQQGDMSVEVFSSNMRPVEGGVSNINWRPVVTVPPMLPESQEILKMQQHGKWGPVSSRRSCLPPGKVDSYLAGPNQEGLFECLFPDCGKLFKRRYNVRSHIQTHLCDRPYPCDACGARFVRPHDLRRHEKGHQEDRAHICPCGRSFTRHDALQRHRNRQICEGGIETPGKPKKPPAKRGRPAKSKVPKDEQSPNEPWTGESESDFHSAVSSPEGMVGPWT